MNEAASAREVDLMEEIEGFITKLLLQVEMPSATALESNVQIRMGSRFRAGAFGRIFARSSGFTGEPSAIHGDAAAGFGNA